MVGKRGRSTFVGLRRIRRELDFNFDFDSRRNVLHLQPPPRVSGLLGQRPLHLLRRHGIHHRLVHWQDF